LNQCLKSESNHLFYKGHLNCAWMPKGEDPGMEGMGAFGDASTIVPDFQVSAHSVTGH